MLSVRSGTASYSPSDCSLLTCVVT